MPSNYLILLCDHIEHEGNIICWGFEESLLSAESEDRDILLDHVQFLLQAKRALRECWISSNGMPVFVENFSGYDCNDATPEGLSISRACT